MMKTAIKPGLKSKTFAYAGNCTLHREKEKGFVNVRSYQKLFIVFISLSTFLIFPESPRELEIICDNYNSVKVCNVW